MEGFISTFCAAALKCLLLVLFYDDQQRQLQFARDYPGFFIPVEIRSGTMG
jgi:hypothetical protein